MYCTNQNNPDDKVFVTTFIEKLSGSENKQDQDIVTKLKTFDSKKNHNIS